MAGGDGARAEDAVRRVAAAAIGCSVAVAACAGGSGAPVAAPVAPVASAPPSAVSSSVSPEPGVLAEDRPPPVPAASAAAPTGAAQSRACIEPCSGSQTPELVAAAMSRAGRAKPCYDRALGAGRAVRGRMQVRIRVLGDGAVCEPQVLASELPEDMTKCVAQVLGGASYPPPSGGCLDVVVPLTFEPRDADAGGAP